MLLKGLFFSLGSVVFNFFFLKKNGKERNYSSPHLLPHEAVKSYLTSKYAPCTKCPLGILSKCN